MIQDLKSFSFYHKVLINFNKSKTNISRIRMGILMMMITSTLHFCIFSTKIIISFAHKEENAYTNQKYNNYCDKYPQPSLWVFWTIISPVEFFPFMILIPFDPSSFFIILSCKMSTKVWVLDLYIGDVTGGIENLPLKSIKSFPIISTNDSNYSFRIIIS